MSSVTGLTFLIFGSHLIFFLAGSVSFSLLLSISLSFLLLLVVVVVVGKTGLGVASNPGIAPLVSLLSCLVLRSFEKSKFFRKSRFMLDTSIFGCCNGAVGAGGEAGDDEEFSS